MPRPTKHQKKVLNALLHQLVRLRDGEWCLRCKKIECLQLSHIYPKGRYRRLEFEPDNVKLLDNGCHIFWWHKNPIEAKEWLKTVVSAKRLQRLKAMTLSRDMWHFDYQLTKLYLEQEIKKYEK